MFDSAHIVIQVYRLYMQSREYEALINLYEDKKRKKAALDK